MISRRGGYWLSRTVKLAPSILNADFSNLQREIRAVEKYSDLIHLDVMDGHFVPNITFGPIVVKAIRRITKIPLECHLMISNLPEWVEDFVRAGADRISFHLEACRDCEGLIRTIKTLGASPGIALSPEIPIFEADRFLELVDFVVVMCVYPGFGGQELIPEMLERVSAIKRQADSLGTTVEIEVDGGVKTENIKKVISAGTDTVVVGSSIFAAENVDAAAREVRKILDEAATCSNDLCHPTA